jgi:hypothetical protein
MGRSGTGSITPAYPRCAVCANPPSAAGEPLANQGAYQQGKVRILGVPVITVAAPVFSGAGTGPDATTRAQGIEGNLAMLYRSLPHMPRRWVNLLCLLLVSLWILVDGQWSNPLRWGALIR